MDVLCIGKSQISSLQLSSVLLEAKKDKQKFSSFKLRLK